MAIKFKLIRNPFKIPITALLNLVKNITHNYKRAVPIFCTNMILEIICL